MSKIKLSTGDFPAETYAVDDVIATVMAAQRGIAQAAGGAGSPFDTGLTTEACYALAAALLEGLPSVATNGDLRTMAEHGGARIHYYLKLFREASKASGHHVFEDLGASKHPPQTLTRQ